MDAYRLLSGLRLWGKVGPFPIMMSEIQAYFWSAGIEDVETRMKYVRLIRLMDLVELSYLRERLRQN